uniref:Tc1-like transposase DDE domain-containing protein n=1 Tax=Astyanax mexicanus TaxID=7994 RepID=A0A3B1KBL5_ASTMX
YRKTHLTLYNTTLGNALKMGFQQNNQNHTIMEWPAQTLDLNPIEHLWGDINDAISRAKPRNANKLWDVVKASWAGILVDRYQTLGDSLPHRCEAVIKNCGYSTKY